MSFDVVPKDIINYIASQLGVLDLVQYSSTSKGHRALCLHDSLWKPFVEELCLRQEAGKSAYETVKAFHTRFNNYSETKLSPLVQPGLFTRCVRYCYELWTGPQRRTPFEANVERWKKESQEKTLIFSKTSVDESGIEINFHLLSILQRPFKEYGFVTVEAAGERHLPILLRTRHFSIISSYSLALINGDRENASKELVHMVKTVETCLFIAVQLGTFETLCDIVQFIENNPEYPHQNNALIRHNRRKRALQNASILGRLDLIYKLLVDNDPHFGSDLKLAPRFLSDIAHDAQGDQWKDIMDACFEKCENIKGKGKILGSLLGREIEAPICNLDFIREKLIQGPITGDTIDWACSAAIRSNNLPALKILLSCKEIPTRTLLTLLTIAKTAKNPECEALVSARLWK